MATFGRFRFLLDESSTDDNLDAVNITEIDPDDKEIEISSAWIIFGIFLGTCGSIGINVGNNLQSMGLQDQQAKNLPKKTTTFWVGSTIFLVASIVNFVAFGFAPASVLAPIESLQFVTNLAFGRIVRKTAITTRMAIGCAMTVVGCIITVSSGPNEVYSFSIRQLEGFWAATGWIVYISLIVFAAVSTQLVHLHYKNQLSMGRTPWNHAYILPLTFAVSSALIGTQSVVQAKCMSELFELLMNGVNIFAHIYFYITLILLAGTGAIWIMRLNKALELYDPLIIIPLLQSTYILCAIVSGGVYFQEFIVMDIGRWFGFCIGIAIMFSGLYVLCSSSRTASSGAATRIDPDGKGASSFAASHPEAIVSVYPVEAVHDEEAQRQRSDNEAEVVQAEEVALEIGGDEQQPPTPVSPTRALSEVAIPPLKPPPNATHSRNNSISTKPPALSQSASASDAEPNPETLSSSLHGSGIEQPPLSPGSPTLST